jgi:hypothetical protein
VYPAGNNVVVMTIDTRDQRFIPAVMSDTKEQRYVPTAEQKDASQMASAAPDVEGAKPRVSSLWFSSAPSLQPPASGL